MKYWWLLALCLAGCAAQQPNKPYRDFDYNSACNEDCGKDSQ